MAGSFVNLNVHIVFSTKNRHPYFDEAGLPRVHEYLGGALHGLGVVPVQVGGVRDHVHLLGSVKATHRLSDIVRELKKSSTRWIRDELGIQYFEWQEGCGAFGVSQERTAGVVKYIANQAEHHRSKSFEEEFVELLRLAEVPYDPKYLF